MPSSARPVESRSSEAVSRTCLRLRIGRPRRRWAQSASATPSQGAEPAYAPVDPEPVEERDATRATPAVDYAEAAPTSQRPSSLEPEADSPAAPTAATDVPPWRRGAAYRAASPPRAEASAPIPPRPGALRPEGIIRLPTTLSGWLIGGGALVGVIGMLLPWVVSGTYTGGWGLASGINLLFTLVLLAVLVLVFLPHLVPDLPQRKLVLLAIALIGVGMGLDRLGLPLTGSGAMIFLIGMLASATGGFLSQLGLDRAVGGQLS